MLDLVIYSLFLRYIYLFYMYEYIFCLYVCLCTTCMPVAWGGQKRASNSWNLSCGWLWTTKWMLGIEPRFSARTSAFNQWGIFPVSIFYILFTSVLFCLSLQEMFSLYSLSVFYFFYTIYFIHCISSPTPPRSHFPIHPTLLSLFLSVCLSPLSQRKERHKSKIQSKQKTKNAKAQQKQC